jgi:murein DD-endopeptidase MepM/ murein hydrolase activator NlpD
MRRYLLVITFLLSVVLAETVAIRQLYDHKQAERMTERARVLQLENDNAGLRKKVLELEEEKKNSMTFSRTLSFPLKDFDATLTQPYGKTAYASAYGGMGLNGHIGIDYAAPEGTPVYASHDGVVFESWEDDTGERTGYGGRVKLRYRNGQNGMETVYAHLSKTLVMVGDFVEEGQLIGNVGNTGFSSRAHLHFGVRVLWFCDVGGKQVGKPCEVLDGDNGMLGWVDPARYLE